LTCLLSVHLIPIKWCKRGKKLPSIPSYELYFFFVVFFKMTRRPDYVVWLPSLPSAYIFFQTNLLVLPSWFPWQIPIPPGNVHAINDTLSAEAAADDYETRLKELVNNSGITSSPLN